MAELAAVTDATFDAQVLKSDRPVVVDFWAEWCEPCHRLAPILQEIANELGDRVKIVKLDVDSNPSVTGQYGIQSIPTLIIFRRGQPVGQAVGAMAKEELRSRLEQAIDAN